MVYIKRFVTVCPVVMESSLLVEELTCLCFQVSLPVKITNSDHSVSAHPRSSESPFSATPVSTAELDTEMFLCFGHKYLLPECVHTHQMNSNSS